MDLRPAIKQRAIEIGFDLVGIAPSTPGGDLEFARDWLERGFGGEMRYLANPKRFDPSTVLPGVKSVICVGLIYDTPLPYSVEAGDSRQKPEGIHGQSSVESSQSSVDGDDGPRTTHDESSPVSNFRIPISGDKSRQDDCAPRGWISRYAWGRDYHEVMRGKLEKLRAAIEELAPGIETRVYVDTGPVIERAFARFSGIGWLGKNTCIINEEKGSWFFLGVILTNLALEPDLPAPDHCGSCRACLDACPTGALVEPYVMDASRCVSYLTIELKGSIPTELRPGVGVNIFGCDICQDVCPWNGKGRIQVSGSRIQEKGFEPMAVSSQQSGVNSWPPGSAEKEQLLANALTAEDEALRSSIQNPKSQIQNLSGPSTQHPAPSTFSLFAPALEGLASMTEEGFRQTFRHSPIKRTKYRGWLRNLCVAMGNSGDTRFVPRLQELSQHPDSIVREHAEWALSRLRKA